VTAFKYINFHPHVEKNNLLIECKKGQHHEKSVVNVGSVISNMLVGYIDVNMSIK
jgi:hypothetical protein